MPGPIFVDTSFIIALINERDQHHLQAEALSHEFEQSQLLTTDAVLLEIGNALAKDYRVEATRIIRILRYSSKAEVRQIDGELFEKGFAIYERYKDKEWGLVDCISFVVMWEAGVSEVLTFDGDFKQAGFSALKIVG